MESDTSGKLVLLKIPSGEDTIAGRMYIAAGEGPHATIIMLHGFPGVVMNFDIATSLHQSGWNVLVINYRGAWGSKGDFSFTNSLEDVFATIKYIKQDDVAIENRVDVNRIALIGHSFGGFLALKTASLDPSIKTIVSMSGANFALFVQMMDQNPAVEDKLYAMLEEGTFFLNGSTPEIIVEEVRDNSDKWNTFLFAPELANRRLLLTAATHDKELPKEYFHDPLVNMLEKANAKHPTIATNTAQALSNRRKMKSTESGAGNARSRSGQASGPRR